MFNIFCARLRSNLSTKMWRNACVQVPFFLHGSTFLTIFRPVYNRDGENRRFSCYLPVITSNQELMLPTGNYRNRKGTKGPHPRGFRVELYHPTPRGFCTSYLGVLGSGCSFVLCSSRSSTKYRQDCCVLCFVFRIGIYPAHSCTATIEHRVHMEHTEHRTHEAKTETFSILCASVRYKTTIKYQTRSIFTELSTSSNSTLSRNSVSLAAHLASAPTAPSILNMVL